MSGQIPFPTRTAEIGGNRWALFGDSITGNSNQSFTSLTTVSRTSGVVSVQKTAHGLITGEKIWVAGLTHTSANPSDLNISDATVTRVDADNFTYPAAGVDVINADVTKTGGTVYKKWQYSGKGYWASLNSLLGGGLNLVGNFGNSGDTTTVMLTRIADVLASDPTDVIVMGGINDISSSATANAVATNLQLIYDQFLTRNIRVWAISILPVETATPAATLAWANAAAAVTIIEANRQIKAYCANNKGIEYVDAYSQFIDPMAATPGYMKDNTAVDGLHPSHLGAKTYLATPIYTKISTALSFPSPLTNSNVDNYASDSGSNNIWDYAPWVSTGNGTAGAGITDAAGTAANWSIGRTGTGTGTATIVARSDGFGYDQQVVYTSGAADDFLYGIFTVSSPTTRAAAGDTVQIMMEVSLANVSGSNLNGAYAQLKQVVGGLSGYAYSGDVSTSAALFGTTDGTHIIITPPMILQTGFTAIEGQVRFYFKAAGTAITIKIGRVSIIKNMFVE